MHTRCPSCILHVIWCIADAIFQTWERSKPTGDVVPALFADAGWAALNHTTISTSNCGNAVLGLFGFGEDFGIRQLRDPTSQDATDPRFDLEIRIATPGMCLHECGFSSRIP